MTNRFINALVAFLMGGATLSFTFTAADADGVTIYNGVGELTTVENKYRMETDDVIVVSDGKVKGIYQKKGDEIVIMPVIGDDDIMDNPFAILKDAEKQYKVTAWKGGKKLYGGAEGELPDKLVLESGNGTLYTIGIERLSENAAPQESLFVLDVKKYPTAVVTDLR